MAECIYNWISEESAAPRKPTRYKSKYDPKAPLAASTFRKEERVVGTFGRNVRGTIKPSAYLKAGERCGRGVDARSQPRKFTRPNPAGTRKPAVPHRSDIAAAAETKAKDFVTANAVEAILAVPPPRTRKQAPDWTAKPDYGKTPAYLERVKQEVEAERELIATMLEAQDAEAAAADGPAVRELSEQERMDMLEGLKAKWDAVNFEYQKITFKDISTSNSSIGQVRAKEECESQLKALERDIQRLSAKGPIYVVDDQ